MQFSFSTIKSRECAPIGSLPLFHQAWFAWLPTSLIPPLHLLTWRKFCELLSLEFQQKAGGRPDRLSDLNQQTCIFSA